MSRYIDADLIEYEPMCRAMGNGMYEDCEIVCKDQIDGIPTADVRENIKGEWIDCGIHGDWAWEMDGHGNSYHIWECSKCEYTIEHRSNYCPNCGAQMKK